MKHKKRYKAKLETRKNTKKNGKTHKNKFCYNMFL